MLLHTLGANLLGNLLTVKGINKKSKGIIRAGEGVIKSKRQGKWILRAAYGHPSSKNNKVDF